jgi:hypothetical protein
MLKPNVSTCANPKCSAEFKRLGDGKLFTEPANVHTRREPRLIVWLCSSCLRNHDLHYDRRTREFVLIPQHKRGTAA